MEHTTSTSSHGPWAELENLAGRKAAAVQAGYLAADGRAPKAKAQLARLRNVDPLRPASDPELYELFFADLPDSLTWTRDDPSRGEVALATALHLHAVHQQGRQEPMHVPGVGLGDAMRRLAVARGSGGELDDGVVTRLNLLVRATSPTMRLHHLRAVIRQLRGENIPLDHGRLAVDLFDLAHPNTSSRVHLRWARDFHARPRRTITPASAGPTETE